MVQRLTYRKRHSYATKSNQHRVVKTPGGKLVYQTTKKMASGPKCLVTCKQIQGITYSVPYALISTHIESLGLGQGLSMGVLNLEIVIPQILVSLGSGPWDQLFGGGNSPAFAVAAVAALISGLIALIYQEFRD